MKLKFRAFAISIIIMMILAIPSAVESYRINDFSDGMSEKQIVFPKMGGEETVYLSIPRGTNVSSFSMLINSFSTDEIVSLEDISFKDGKKDNLITDDSILKLSLKDKWWNNTWHYRVTAIVKGVDDKNESIPVFVIMNFTEFLNKFNISYAVDLSSIRVIEIDNYGYPIPYNESEEGDERYEIPVKIEKQSHYDKWNNEVCKIYFMLKEGIKKNEIRKFHIYFDTENFAKLPSKKKIEFYKDIIFANGYPAGQDAFIYLGSKGGFDKSIDFYLPTIGACSVATADLNRDGYIDVILPNFWDTTQKYANSTYIYYNKKGFFGVEPDVRLPSVGSFHVKAYDLNLDGFLDIIIPNYANGKYPQLNLSVKSYIYYGSPSGFNNTPDVTLTTVSAMDVDCGDINQDGWPDIVFANEGNYTTGNIYSYLYYGSPNGFNSTPDVKFFTQYCEAVNISDVNNDGFLDIVFANLMNSSLPWPEAMRINSFVYFGKKGGFAPGNYNNPNMSLPTYGALDVKCKDVNNDGYPDVIFANYNDGATVNTLSCIYFMGQSADNKADAWFQTSWAYSVDVEDINDDGYMDVVFANTFNGSDYKINSSVFLGPLVGLKTLPDIKLPTSGAEGVAITDFDRYFMEYDMNAPEIRIEDIEGVYVEKGIYLSKVRHLWGNITSISMDLIYTKPPEGTNISVEISCNNGESWEEMSETEEFKNITHKGKNFIFKIIFTSYRGVKTPLLKDISFNLKIESYPSNLWIDIGADGTWEVKISGELRDEIIVNESRYGIASALARLIPQYGVGNVMIPVAFRSNTSGGLIIHSLEIVGNFPPHLIKPLPEITLKEDEPMKDIIDLSDYFKDDDGDVLYYNFSDTKNIKVIIENSSVSIYPASNWSGKEVIELHVSDGKSLPISNKITVVVEPVDDPPRFTKNLPKVIINQGDEKKGVFNLLEYVEDIDTPHNGLYFSISDISPDIIEVSIDRNNNIDISSKGSPGNVTVGVKVRDALSYDEASFVVEVTKISKAPIITSLPMILMSQGEKVDNAFNLLNYTHDEDTPPNQITFRIVSIDDPRCGVKIDNEYNVDIFPDKDWYGSSYVVIEVSDGEHTTKASFIIKVSKSEKTITTPSPEKKDDWYIGIFALIGIIIVLLVADILMRYRRFTGREAPQEVALMPSKPSTQEEIATEEVKVSEKTEEEEEIVEEEEGAEEEEIPEREIPVEEIEVPAKEIEAEEISGPEEISFEEIPPPEEEEIEVVEMEGPPIEEREETLKEVSETPMEEEIPEEGDEEIEKALGEIEDEKERFDVSASLAEILSEEKEKEDVEEKEEAQVPLKKVRCAKCKSVIPIYTEERPLIITCPACGKKGKLSK